MQLAMVAAGFTPGEADRLRRAMAAWKRTGGLEPFEKKLKEGMASERLRAGVRRRDLPADPRLRRVRLSGIALGELRAARLRLLLAQVPPPGRVLRGAAQQPADGLLRALAARAGRAPPRRGSAPARRERERVGLHAGGRARCASDCAWSGGLSEAAGTTHCRSGRPYGSVPGACKLEPQRTCAALAHGGRAAGAGRASPPGALGGGRRGAPGAAAMRRAGDERAPALLGAARGRGHRSPITPASGLTLGRHPLALLRKQLQKMS